MGNIRWSEWVDGFVQRLSRLLGVIAILVLVAMMIFTVLNVIMRGFFNHPIPGDVELTEVGMICVGFLGLAWCALKGMHIRVDLLVGFFPKRSQALVDSVGYLIGLIMAFFLAWTAIQEGIGNKDLNSLSATLEFPIYPFYWVVALGYAVLCLSVLLLLMRSISGVLKK